MDTAARGGGYMNYLLFLSFLIFSASSTDPGLQILDHSCVSRLKSGHYNYKCLFYTNLSSQLHRVSWKISFKVELVHCKSCLEKSPVRECEKLHVLPSAKDRKFDVLECELTTNYLYMYAFYYWNVTAGYRQQTANYRQQTDSTNVTTSRSPSVVVLEQPEVLNTSVTVDSLSLQVQLNQHETDSTGEGHEGYVEYDAMENGVRYRVSTHATHGLAQPEVRVYTNKGPRNWIHITDLEPFTTYDISVTNQLNNTVNTDIWSQSTNLTLSTRAPPSLPSFSIRRDTRCQYGRQAQLYWKHLGAVNTTSVEFYQVHIGNGTAQQSTPNELPEGSRSVELCISNSSEEVTVTPFKMDNATLPVYKYYIPSAEDVLELRECDISVDYVKSSDEMTVSWSLHTRSYNYTVFWCNTDFGDQCVEQVEWRSVESADNKVKFKSGGNFLRYKFGVSLNDGMMRSSGIIWHNCINHLDRDLSTPTIHVSLFDLEATVTIKDSCVKNTRRAEYYSALSCVYDVKRELCVSEEHKTTLQPCHMHTTIQLARYAQNYAFWVVSHAGNMTAKSKVIIENINGRSWLGLLFIIPAAVTMVLIILYIAKCLRQRRMVKRLRTPMLVQPTDLLMQNMDMSEDNSKFHEYDEFDPLNGEIVFTEFSLKRGDESKHNVEDTGSQCNDLDSYAPAASSESYLPLYSDKVKVELADGNDCNHSMSSIDSYFKCVAVESTDVSCEKLNHLPNVALDHQLSLENAATGVPSTPMGAIIDLDKFLYSGGDNSKEIIAMCLNNESPEIFESGKGVESTFSVHNSSDYRDSGYLDAQHSVTSVLTIT